MLKLNLISKLRLKDFLKIEMNSYLKIEIFLKIEMSSYLKIEIREAKLSQSRYLQSNPGKYDTLTVEVQEVATVSCGGVPAWRIAGFLLLESVDCSPLCSYPGKK